MAATDLTAARLRELLHYDPETGVFRWRQTRPKARINGIAGGISSHGYIKIGVCGHGQQYAHRLAWLYMNGIWPDREIDHIDGDKTNNRWANLRHVSSKINKQNKRSAQSNNKCGLLGVSLSSSRKTCPRKWLAQIALPNGKHISLGLHHTPEEAHAAYLEAKRKLHDGCSI